MGLSFTPQGTTPTPTLEVNPNETPITPADDFFEVQTPSSVGLESPSPEIQPAATETEPTPEITTPEIRPSSAPVEVRKKPTPRVAVTPHPTTLSHKDPITVQIEKIMEEGIGEAYQELTPVQKQQFKIKGEETANQIKLLLHATKIKVKKIFTLLLEWLKLLPGVNKFFLMQEAKIKTDKILGIKNHIQ